MKPFIEVLFLVPEEEAASLPPSRSFMKDSAPGPPGFVAVPSGHSLANWDALTTGWTLADVVAFRDFLAGRARPVFDLCLREVARTRARMRESPNLLVRAAVALREAGLDGDEE